MSKLLLISILAITIGVPIAASRATTPGLALRRLVWWMLAGIGIYAFVIMFVYPRLVS